METITKYFNAEKYEGVLFVLTGVLAIAIATYSLTKIKVPFYNGLAYPLIAVAIIQIVVGSAVYFRSPQDIKRMDNFIKTDKAAVKTIEIPRMQLVMRNFVLYRWIELALLLAGLSLVIGIQTMNLWKGIGCGLSVQAGLMLLLDFFAESRGKVYLNYLQSLQ
ncbi:MAG: hypothetical protein LW692_02875 [Sphingobacteriales bacterium]|jgi:hypothetical protein|nr:hypothetical protein [Sphingobacteriales bacterium]